MGQSPIFLAEMRHGGNFGKYKTSTIIQRKKENILHGSVSFILTSCIVIYVA